MIQSFKFKTKAFNFSAHFKDDLLVGLNFYKGSSFSKSLPLKASKLQKELNSYFEGKKKFFDIDIQVNGSDFQKRVYNQMLKIPYGKTMTYKDLAQKVNSPKAFRAVGSCCKKNPLAILVPCHRIIATKGLGGYNGGTSIKERLLNLEKTYN